MNTCPTCKRPMQQKQGLSREQAKFLRELKAFHHEQGFAPSIKETAIHFDRSESAIWQRLAVLERKGHIHHSKHHKNSVSFID